MVFPFGKAPEKAKEIPFLEVIANPTQTLSFTPQDAFSNAHRYSDRAYLGLQDSEGKLVGSNYAPEIRQKQEERKNVIPMFAFAYYMLHTLQNIKKVPNEGITPFNLVFQTTGICPSDHTAASIILFSMCQDNLGEKALIQETARNTKNMSFSNMNLSLDALLVSKYKPVDLNPFKDYKVILYKSII